MTKLLFLSECFPLVLDFRGLVLPLLADDLGDFWIRKAWILGNNVGLMVLAV